MRLLTYNVVMPLGFDISSGKLLEIDADAIEDSTYIQHIVPIGQLVTSAEFPYKPGDFSVAHVPGRSETDRDGNTQAVRHEHEQWKTEEVLHIGSLIARELAELEPPASFNINVVSRLHILGLFPHLTYLTKHPEFRGINGFRKAIGAEARFTDNNSRSYDEYKGMTTSSIASLIVERYNDLVEFPDDQRFEGPLTTAIITEMNMMGLAPSLKHIYGELGGLGELNECLGFPDITKWTEDDYIQYGADILRHNGPKSLTRANITLLASHGFGPSKRSIEVRFFWRTFCAQSQKRLNYQTTMEENHRKAVEDFFTHRNGHDGHNIPLTFEQKAQYRGLSLLLKHYHIDTDDVLQFSHRKDPVKYTLLKISHALLRYSLGEVETTAARLGIFDDIWPPLPPRRVPCLAQLQSIA